MEKINLSDLLEPEHMDPVKRIALIRIVDDDGGVRESYKFLRKLFKTPISERWGSRFV